MEKGFTLNGIKVVASHIETVGDLIKWGCGTNEGVASLCPTVETIDLICHNGFQIYNRQFSDQLKGGSSNQSIFDALEQPLSNQDEVIAFSKKDVYQAELIRTVLYGRHTPGVQRKLECATVGIAGLGGLGSNCAVSLARMGIGKLILIDFDVVDLTNINRQAYRLSHLGLKKTEAMKQLIQEINPFVEVEVHDVYLDDKQAEMLLGNCKIVVEAFDQPDNKALLCNSLLSLEKGPIIIAGSGMAGFGNSNTIQTKQFHQRLYLVGDLVTGAENGVGLMAPRVAIAANHQANIVVELLTNQEV